MGALWDPMVQPSHTHISIEAAKPHILECHLLKMTHKDLEESWQASLADLEQNQPTYVVPKLWTSSPTSLINKTGLIV